jgi:hypothetical protein
MFLCFAHLDLVSVGFTGARGTANNSSTTHGCLARGFNCPGSRSVVLGDTDTDSFTYPFATYRRAFQKFEGALDWSGGDGWSRLGHCD